MAMKSRAPERFRRAFSVLCALLILAGVVYALFPYREDPIEEITTEAPLETQAFTVDSLFSLNEVPEFNGSLPYCTVNGNVPYFQENDFSLTDFESYSDLDAFGRCGTAFALLGIERMPTEPRGSIGMIRPSGWHTVKYDCIEDRYLYNRCHLIGYQLAGENDNELNLITGTRFLNVQGMLPFENKVADYIKSTRNHVLYRVTPVFQNENLVASGVLMEASSVEDGGEGVRFCVFLYNVQPGVIIDYATGDSALAETTPSDPTPENVTYLLNTRSLRFHRLDCEQARSIAAYNRKETDHDRDTLIREGYTPCGFCKP